MRFKGTLDKPGKVTLNGQAAWMSQGGTMFEGNVTLSAGATSTVAVVAGNLASPPVTRLANYQVSVPTGTSKSYGYDLAGNLSGDGSKTYTWDALNRVTKIAYAGGASSEFTYDALGRRVKIVEPRHLGNAAVDSPKVSPKGDRPPGRRRSQKNASSAVTETRHFVWDGMEPAERRDGSGSLVRRYYPEGYATGTASSPAVEEKFYYTKDHLGSIRQVVDANGVVAAEYDYDPYGRQETGLPAGPKLWLSADSGVSMDASNKVILWQEQSGSGEDATAPSAGARPTWVASGLNGQPVLHFDGDDQLNGEAEFEVGSGDLTMFVVSKRTSAVAWAAPFSFNENHTGNPLLTWDAADRTR